MRRARDLSSLECRAPSLGSLGTFAGEEESEDRTDGGSQQRTLLPPLLLLLLLLTSNITEAQTRQWRSSKTRA